MQNFNNERDIEVPAMLEFVAEHKVESLLDVGAHWSHALYAHELRKLVRVYHGIDMQEDEATAAILDRYTVGNVLKLDSRRKHDCVVSMSTLEHCGITSYQVEDYEKERNRVYKKCLSLSRRHVWMSFPVGPPHLIEGQYATIDDATLTGWLRSLTRSKFTDVETKYYLYDLDSDSYGVVSRAEAMAAEYPPVGKCPAFCILEASK